MNAQPKQQSVQSQPTTPTRLRHLIQNTRAGWVTSPCGLMGANLTAAHDRDAEPCQECVRIAQEKSAKEMERAEREIHAREEKERQDIARMIESAEKAARDKSAVEAEQKRLAEERAARDEAERLRRNEEVAVREARHRAYLNNEPMPEYPKPEEKQGKPASFTLPAFPSEAGANFDLPEDENADTPDEPKAPTAASVSQDTNISAAPVKPNAQGANQREALTKRTTTAPAKSPKFSQDLD